MSITQQLEDLMDMIRVRMGDASRFDDKGVDAAGKRLRKMTLEMQAALKETRAAIQEKRNS